MNTLKKISYYLLWLIRYKFKDARIPLNSSIILTDKCNLYCRHCIVANLGRKNARYEDVLKDIGTLYEMGSRMLVITGGEPFIWEDGDKNLEDVVTAAKKMGFFRIVVCTNGTYRLASSADYLWVSLDGYPDQHNAIRGDVYDKVLRNIESSTHKNIYINFTIGKLNLKEFDVCAELMLKKLRIKGILFHLFTPYLGSDMSIMLDESERKDALERIYQFKRRHPLKVSNTFDGLKALQGNAWERPLWTSAVIDQGEIGPCCCRKGIYDNLVCEKCGCSPAVETFVLQKMKPLAVIENLRFL